MESKRSTNTCAPGDRDIKILRHFQMKVMITHSSTGEMKEAFRYVHISRMKSIKKNKSGVMREERVAGRLESQGDASQCDQTVRSEPYTSLTFTAQEVSRRVGGAGGYGSWNGRGGGDGAGCGGEERWRGRGGGGLGRHRAKAGLQRATQVITLHCHHAEKVDTRRRCADVTVWGSEGVFGEEVGWGGTWRGGGKG